MVRVPVVGVVAPSDRLPNRASASSKNRIRRRSPLRPCRSTRAEVLLRLADVLAHDRGQVDGEQVQSQRTGDDLCCHRLARSRRSGEQGADPLAPGQLRVEAPLVHHPCPVLHPRHQFPQLGHDVGRKDQVVPGVGDRYPTGEGAQLVAALAARGGEEIGRGQRRRPRKVAVRTAVVVRGGVRTSQSQPGRDGGGPGGVQRSGWTTAGSGRRGRRSPPRRGRRPPTRRHPATKRVVGGREAGSKARRAHRAAPGPTGPSVPWFRERRPLESCAAPS